MTSVPDTAFRVRVSPCTDIFQGLFNPFRAVVFPELLLFALELEEDVWIVLELPTMELTPVFVLGMLAWVKDS